MTIIESNLKYGGNARRVILEDIGRRVVINLFSKIDYECVAHDPTGDLPYHIWRTIRFLPKDEYIDKAIDNIVLDIIDQKIKHFIRLPNFQDLTSRVEGNGISIRTGVELFPELKLSIDYCGWK